MRGLSCLAWDEDEEDERRLSVSTEPARDTARLPALRDDDDVRAETTGLFDGNSANTDTGTGVILLLLLLIVTIIIRTLIMIIIIIIITIIILLIIMTVYTAQILH